MGIAISLSHVIVALRMQGFPKGGGDYKPLLPWCWDSCVPHTHLCVQLCCSELENTPMGKFLYK